jgi:NADPH:quinone reductase
MQALVCHHLSPDLSGISVSEMPVPMLRSGLHSGTLRIKISAAAFNFPDLLMTRGGYQFKPELPFILGTEACGVCEEVGAGCDPAWLGRRVMITDRQGCMAEQAIVPEAQARLAPDALSDAEAASLTVTGLTAWVGLMVCGRLQAGERVLVMAAGSGVSLAAIDIAHAVGATVIAAASSEAKLAAARAKGVARAIVTPRMGMSAADFKATLGAPVDVVYDPIGGVLAEPAVRSLNWRGRYLVIGFASGEIPKLPLNLALLKGIDIIGVRAGEYGRRDPAAQTVHLSAIDALAACGAFRPLIGVEAPIEKAIDLLRAMDAGTMIGKAVVRFS